MGYQQRESDKQWQDAETEDEREARLHWEREIGRGELLWTLPHLSLRLHTTYEVMTIAPPITDSCSSLHPEDHHLSGNTHQLKLPIH